MWTAAGDEPTHSDRDSDTEIPTNPKRSCSPSLSLSLSGFSAYAWISYVKADGWFMAYQPYTIRTSSKNEKKAKKAEKRKTAAVRNSAINMQIK